VPGPARDLDSRRVGARRAVPFSASPIQMNLLDLRRYAIRRRTRIRFTIASGVECVVNEHGVVKLPAFRGVADFNTENSLVSVEQFVLEPVDGGAKQQKLSREKLEALVGEAPKTEQHHEE
jgi:hypothetical protein